MFQSKVNTVMMVNTDDVLRFSCDLNSVTSLSSGYPRTIWTSRGQGNRRRAGIFSISDTPSLFFLTFYASFYISCHITLDLSLFDSVFTSLRLSWVLAHQTFPLVLFFFFSSFGIRKGALSTHPASVNASFNSEEVVYEIYFFLGIENILACIKYLLFRN